MEGPLTSSPPIDGLIMKKASKAFGSIPREAKDEVQQENQFSPPSSPLPLRERFTGLVMTAHNNNSHILLLQSDNGIRRQSNLPQNKVVICVLLGVENGLSSLNDYATLS